MPAKQKTKEQILHAKKMNARRVQRWRERRLKEDGLISVQVLVPPESLPQLRELERSLRRGSRML